MKAVVIYESMYGNTHAVADEIAAGLREAAEVVVTPVDGAEPAMIEDAALVVVGGPTHAHGMSRPATRHSAVDAARKSEGALKVEPHAEDTGLREWFEALGKMSARAAAFDTRIDAPAALTGRASKGIAKQLRRHGCTLIAEPESFFVTKDNHLEPDEDSRARRWGASLAASIMSPA